MPGTNEMGGEGTSGVAAGDERSNGKQRGVWQWDWYLVVAGAFKSVHGNGGRWADGTGPVLVATLPPALLGETEAEGELWFVGGQEAYTRVRWTSGPVGPRRLLDEWVRDRHPVKERHRG